MKALLKTTALAACLGLLLAAAPAAHAQDMDMPVMDWIGAQMAADRMGQMLGVDRNGHKLGTHQPPGPKPPPRPLRPALRLA